ncbi:glycoside hydrolase [Chloropicon primus]|uniref:mannan endo-1,4-beta-mannosidase n=1 Tax=Chloropicon primus TaxID=1764295 RepID=A0A5B8MR40_9CHLO|nr:glycoside hydrolase [Chloropicon primus]|eukprot:QDZ22797.1 glycoside hydrolase [Chloropicon primus]
MMPRRKHAVVAVVAAAWWFVLAAAAVAAAAYDDTIRRDDAGFVHRQGSHLYDARGNPFFIVGTNSYYLLEHASESESWLKRSIVDETFEAARNLGLNTVRTWAFYDGKLQTSPGVYDENWLDALDYVVARAGEHGLKLVLTLTNYWDAYGGMEEYVKWANDANETAGLSITEFYTSEAIRDMYRSNFLALKDRVNTYTNLTYANDPTILAWELANEPRNPGDFTGEVLQGWIAEMSQFVKDHAPNQLVTSGSEGFFGPSTLQYMYLNGNGTFDHKQYTAQMCTGVDFLTNHDETTAIDLPSFHLYPDHHAEELCGRGAPASDCALQWARAQTEARLRLASQVLGKPLYLGEFGKMKHPLMEGTLDAQVVYRNRLYSQVYNMIQQSAVDAFDEESQEFSNAVGVGGGSTFWMLASPEYKDYDNFTVYSGGNGPSLPPPWVPSMEAVATQSDFRNYREEQECVAKVLGQHPDWTDHHWFVAGRDADEWYDTVRRMEEDDRVYTRKFTSGHHPEYTFTFDPAIAEKWYLDASTVALIQNHASNMNQLARLNKHNWWG